MADADDCPPGCGHEGFHYCGASGTHCDRHCTCVCRLCVEERLRVRARQIALKPADLEYEQIIVLLVRDAARDGGG